MKITVSDLRSVIVESIRDKNRAAVLAALSQSSMTKEEMLLGPLKGMAPRTLDSYLGELIKSGQVVKMPGERIEGGTKPLSRYRATDSVPDGAHVGLSALESEIVDFLSEQGPSSTEAIKLGVDSVNSSGVSVALQRLEGKGTVKMVGIGRGRGPGMKFWALSSDSRSAPETLSALTQREEQILDLLRELGEGTYLAIMRKGGLDRTVVQHALRRLEDIGRVVVVGHARPFRATQEWPVYKVVETPT